MMDAEERKPLIERSFQDSEVQNGADVVEPTDGKERDEIKVYKWRWVVLAVIVTDLCVNNAMWITLSPISNVAKCYYATSDFWINSVSMVYMLTYILFIVPSAWLLNSAGLRTTAVIAACLNAAGACLRVAGTGHEYFWLLLTGQTITSLSNLLLWGSPSFVAGIWFPSSERGIAAATIGALAPQLGVVTSYILGPLLVQSDHTNSVCGGNATSETRSAWTDTIYYQLLYYLLGQAAVSLMLVFITLLAIPTAPPTPPSRSQQLVDTSRDSKKVNSLRNTVRLIAKNRHFLLLLLTSSINIGAAGAVVSLFNEVIHPYFEDRDRDEVYIGITALVPGMLTVVVVGPILGATKAFYAMNVIIYTATFLSIAGFLAALEFLHNFNVLYPFVAVIGASVTGFQALVYEYAAEMTYPLSGGTSGGLVNWVSQPMSILMIIVGPRFGTVNGHTVPFAWTIAGLTLIGAIITVFIRPDLRKTDIDRESSTAKSSINNERI